MSDVISCVRDHLLTTTRTCLRLLGHTAACTNMVYHAWLLLRLLQAWLASVYVPNRHNLDPVVEVPDQVWASLAW